MLWTIVISEFMMIDETYIFCGEMVVKFVKCYFYSNSATKSEL
jgi:hypothetical protein